MPNRSAPLATAERAIQIRIVEPEMQAYLQRYPFATGPDAALNERGRELLATGISLRPEAAPRGTTQLSPEDAALAPPDEAAIRALMSVVHLSAEAQEKHLNDFGWKVKNIPRSAQNVLVIGCGDGVELMFLRGVLPQARIIAIDYYDSLLPGLRDAVSFEHKTGDMNALLLSLAIEYDLIFSNHTLEHLYAPDDLLQVLKGLLVPGGMLVSALPMCSCVGTPFLEKLRTFAAKKESAKIHPLDTVFLDAGHPWKTNPADLAATLERAGFGGVEILQRREHLCRPLAAGRLELTQKQASYSQWNAMFLGPARWLLKAIFPQHIPEGVARMFYAVERRVPFGTNLVMNVYCEEALFECRKP